MKRRAEARGGKQGTGGGRPVERTLLGQLLLPLVSGALATRETLHGLVHQMGIAVMEELFREDAEKLVGKRGRHQTGRQLNHWGTTLTRFPFAGRTVALRRPRVRRVNGGEVKLPLVEELRGLDPVCERVMDQILLGVSTRGYGRSLGPLPADLRGRGATKSTASRHVVERTKARLAEFLKRRLEGIELAALMLDGLAVAESTVVVAMGIDTTGTKHPLGLWLGSTENADLCVGLLHNLLERGLKIPDRLLVVIDGAKGLRKALEAVLGNAAIVQRCQLHKLRNVKSHLPKACHPYVSRVMREAYRSATASTARKRLRSLVSWLDSNGHVDAARSLREGLEETLTVIKLGLPATLCRTLSTTNPIENLIGTIRRVTRNVKRWRDGRMVHRWVGLALSHAQQSFRRIKGHRDLPILQAALHSVAANPSTVDSSEVAA